MAAGNTKFDANYTFFDHWKCEKEIAEMNCDQLSNISTY